MRKILKSTSEVTHFWANRVQPEGRSGNVFFRESMIYSYGLHFCMARHLPGGAVAITTRTYSPTTSHHISDVRSAVNHLQRVYCNDPSQDAWDNRAAAERDLLTKLAQAEKPRIRQVTRERLQSEAYSVASNFNAYLFALPESERADMATREAPEPFDLSKLKEYRAVKEAADIERARRRAERATESLNLWRKREAYSTLLTSLPPALRLSTDRATIETSWGAEIPASVAEPVWTLVQTVRASGADLELPHPRRIGAYLLQTVHADGSIRVGCHHIAYSELAQIAGALGYAS